MYVAVKGGERAIANAHKLFADRRRGDRSVPALTLAQIAHQLGFAVDRVMSEGSLFDRELAALAIKQTAGDLIEAIFLIRAYRTTLPRFGASRPIATGAMLVERRVSATYKDLPGGQVLGPTFDYSHRLLDFVLAAEGDVPAPERLADVPSKATPNVSAILDREGLIEPHAPFDDDAEVEDLTREPLDFPASRALRLQNLARGDEGFLLALGYSTQRGYARGHAFAGEIRMGEVEVEFFAPELGFEVPLGRVQGDGGADGHPVHRLRQGAAAVHARLRADLRPVRAQGDGDGAGRPGAALGGVRRGADRAGAGPRIRALPFRQHPGHRLRGAPEAAPTTWISRRSWIWSAACAPKPRRRRNSRSGKRRSDPRRHQEAGRMSATSYNFAYLDEQTKRMIRRAILKAIAIPGYQVPFAAREMPMPYGWGTGGVQVTASIIGADDVLKMIDQGSDDTTNAVALRGFFETTAGVATTTRTADATIIQTRHRIPEATLTEGQVIVYQVPIPEPLRFLEPRETETRKMHALEEYGLMHVKLYEDIATHGHIATTYAYPVKVAGRYVMDPSPTPKFDNPKMDRMAALQLYGAGREKRIYAIPPFTDVVSLDFEDHPFDVQDWPDTACALCGATGVYFDEVITDDAGGRMFCCSDSDFCETRREAGHLGAHQGEAA